ncbi:putative nuclear RNA export factor SDE5 isoform X2 [Magnolia sinica]|uniref:putative nuclear RNA export factor SDE5 isoform X2 n=1 Tax=Magnolia sinica TaxID=86752 RepID=UPI002657FE6B|nr:putative nuclear RNA export factor SDE5 isoform X2 [Magnolia sinica]
MQIISEMDTSCSSKSDDEARALKGLLDAFGSSLSLEVIASAYCKAGCNVDRAGDILYGLQESDSSAASHTSNAVTCATNGECSGSKSQELLLENDFDMSTHLNKNSKGPKPRKFSYSVGTVSSVLGKGYARPTSSSHDAGKTTKPLKLEMKDAVATDSAPRIEPMNNKDVEGFLFAMLGDGFQLGMDVIREVLSQCGYDAKKSMNRLLDMSATTLDKSVAGDAMRKVQNKSSKESHSSQGRLQIKDFAQSGTEGRNGTESPCMDKGKHDLSRQVLESLFSVPEKYEETPRKNRPARAVKKKAIGRVVTAPLTDDVDEPSPETVEPHDDTEDAEEDKYQILRRAAKQNWDAKWSYYEAALDAFLKGDRAQANYFLEEGKNYDKKARELDEKSSGEILEVRKNGVKDLLPLDVHNCQPKEAIHLLKFHLKSLAGITSFQQLKVIIETNAEDITKGARKRRMVKFLEKESIKWTEEEGNPGTILIRVDEIDPKSLSFA